MWVGSSKFTCSFLTFADFGNGYQDPFSHTYAIQPDLLGVINAAYNLGGILAVPVSINGLDDVELSCRGLSS